nr:VanZ family protein [Arthrobacter sp. SDTb3-6]
METVNTRSHRIAVALAAAYVLALALILFWPTPVDRPVDGTLNEVIRWAHRHGVPRAIGYHQVEFTSNIALFVPMGYLASVWWRNSWVGLLTGCLISCCVELSQTLFLPHRVGSGLDVLANTTGAGVGAVIVYIAERRLRSRRDLVETPGG